MCVRGTITIEQTIIIATTNQPQINLVLTSSQVETCYDTKDLNAIIVRDILKF